MDPLTNSVECFLKKTRMASIKVLKRELNLNKKQVKRFIRMSGLIKPVNPVQCGSFKRYIPVFEYLPDQVKQLEQNDSIEQTDQEWTVMS
uniref:Uncharacterized protein n=1 Tax=viral metagenome TaxID=1070528 RepID=A0A6C0I896_9ZZZZ